MIRARGLDPQPLDLLAHGLELRGFVVGPRLELAEAQLVTP